MQLLIRISDETAKKTYLYFKDMLDLVNNGNMTISPYLLEYAEAYLKAYNFKHGSDLPVIDEIKDVKTEICCENCMYDGNQILHLTACTSCCADEEYKHFEIKE